MAHSQITPAVGRPEPHGRLRVVRKYQPWTSLTPRVEVAVDGVSIGEIDQGEVVEGSVGAGTHELAVRPARALGRGRWQATIVRIEPGGCRGVLVSTMERHSIWRTVADLVLAMLSSGSAGVGWDDPDVQFADLELADPGKPRDVTRVIWLVLVAVVAATFLIEPLAAPLIALVGLIAILGARLQAGARRHLRRPDVLPPWTRARLTPG